jgi:hypothetical protein
VFRSSDSVSDGFVRVTLSFSSDDEPGTRNAKPQLRAKLHWKPNVRRQPRALAAATPKGRCYRRGLPRRRRPNATPGSGTREAERRVWRGGWWGRFTKLKVEACVVGRFTSSTILYLRLN